MTGWLIYEAFNVERNRFFIDRWMAAAQARSVDLRLVTTDQLAWGIRGGAPFLELPGGGPAPGFIVMRAPLPLLSAHAESLGIPVFNGARLSLIANDKRRTHQLFSGVLPMMDTAFVDAQSYRQPFPWPVVVKAAGGCGGRQVYLARDEAGYRGALSRVAPDSAVVQPLCDSPGQDIRVYVLGGQVIACMQRWSDSDFRSNVGLGARSRPLPLPDDIRACVDEVVRRLDIGLCGVDFIRHQGRHLFNEIEDAVGTRMLYMHTGRDVASDYLGLILNRIKM